MGVVQGTFEYGVDVVGELGLREVAEGGEVVEEEMRQPRLGGLPGPGEGEGEEGRGGPVLLPTAPEEGGAVGGQGLGGPGERLALAPRRASLPQLLVVVADV